MGEDVLLSLGLDLGTSTTQLILSRLTLENAAASWAVPRIAIAKKEILYRSPIHFTPLLSHTRIDADAIRDFVAAQYRQADIRPEEIDTGAVIITGETARKENARQVLSALAGFAGDCVVATAGPDLEAVLAAKGAGIPQYSKDNHLKILHFDLGGGTSNWSLYENGALLATGCLNVGGRLVKVCRETRRITYCSDQLWEWTAGNPAPPRVGDLATEELLLPVAEKMAEKLLTLWPGDCPVGFSGGVADCIFAGVGDLWAYGDMGPLLGRVVADNFRRQGISLYKGRETIGATVVGAGAHSAQLSGSTIFYRHIPFPLKNLPVLRLTDGETETDATLSAALRRRLTLFSDREGLTQIAVALAGEPAPDYARVTQLARGLREGLSPLLDAGLLPLILVEEDLAKALGGALFPLVPGGAVLCLDGISCGDGDYLDLLPPAYGGAVLPVVVKTLVFEKT